MSIYCQITLPPAARLRDVATVLARLTGAPMTLLTSPVLAAQVDGIIFQPMPDIPECVRINWQDGDRKIQSVLYHYEWSASPGCHGIMLRSTPEGRALAKALVDFFGGTVDDREDDAREAVYTVPARPDIHASDGESWDAFQRRMAAVEPLDTSDTQPTGSHT